MALGDVNRPEHTYSMKPGDWRQNSVNYILVFMLKKDLPLRNFTEMSWIVYSSTCFTAGFVKKERDQASVRFEPRHFRIHLCFEPHLNPRYCNSGGSSGMIYTKHLIYYINYTHFNWPIGRSSIKLHLTTHTETTTIIIIIIMMMIKQ